MGLRGITEALILARSQLTASLQQLPARLLEIFASHHHKKSVLPIEGLQSTTTPPPHSNTSKNSQIYLHRAIKPPAFLPEPPPPTSLRASTSLQVSRTGSRARARTDSTGFQNYLPDNLDPAIDRRKHQQQQLPLRPRSSLRTAKHRLVLVENQGLYSLVSISRCLSIQPGIRPNDPEPLVWSSSLGLLRSLLWILCNFRYITTRKPNIPNVGNLNTEGLCPSDYTINVQDIILNNSTLSTPASSESNHTNTSVMSIKMYGNLTANQLISGGRLILSVELKTKILNYCATHQISAHALPRDAEELVELFRFMDWNDAATIPSLTEALGTKLLAFVRNNITSDKLRPGLIEVQDPDTKIWTATWKMYTLAWAEEGGFVWGNIINELDLETMHPALKQDREPEVRPYIAPAALVGQTVAFVVGVDSKDVRDAEEIEEEGDEMEEVIQQQRPRTSLRVQQQTANRLQQQQAAQLAQQQADNFLQQQQAANILQQQQAAQEAAHILQKQQAAQVVTQQAEALRVEAERVEAQRVANEQMAQHLQHLASQAAEAEAKRFESERSASQRISQSLLEAKQMDDQYNAAQHANDAAKAKRVEAIRIEAQKVEAQRLANERQAQELANQAAEAEQKAQLLQDMQSQIFGLRDQMAAAAAADRQANQYSVPAPNHYSAKPSQVAEIAIPAPAPKFVRPANYAKPTIPAPAPPVKAKAIKKVTGKDNTIQAKTGTTAQEFDYQNILADTLARSAPPQQQKATAATTPNYESILANIMAHRGNKTPTNWAPVAPTSTYKQIQADTAAHKANVAAPAPATKPNSTTTSKAKTAISASYDAILAKLVSGSGATAGPSTVPKVAAMTKNSAAITAAGMGGLRRSARVKAIAAGN